MGIADTIDCTDAACIISDVGCAGEQLVLAVTVWELEHGTWQRSTKSVGIAFWPCFDFCFLGALSPFFPLPLGIPWLAACEKLALSLFFLYHAKNFQSMAFLSATATV